MGVWFEGSNEIECSIEKVKNSLEDPGEHYVGVVAHMPGMANVSLVEQGTDFVTIRTNEGLMKRTRIRKLMEAERVVVELDEEYEAGSSVTARSHFLEEFTRTDAGVKYRVSISDVEARGFLGFLYRKFGRSKMGAAFLKSCKTYLERADM
ncbi:hypothetical protein KKG90_05145 [Candidatus Bipolaricaulota bacterium]|nr:hypothetical protein [Candidatus Bipolaricaulota bacterium]